MTPAAVERLNAAQLYPIVVFFRADTKHSVKAVRSRMAKGSRKSSRKLFETSQKLESMYGHLFTSSVALVGEDPTAWYQKLREVRAILKGSSFTSSERYGQSEKGMVPL